MGAAPGLEVPVTLLPESPHDNRVAARGVFGSRGQDVVIPQGTTMEMVLDRELRFTDSELFGRF